MPSAFPSGRVDLGVTEVRKETIGLTVVLIIESALLYLLLQRTKLGLMLRAVASNAESSPAGGHQLRARMLMFGWALSAPLGAAAGAGGRPAHRLRRQPHAAGAGVRLRRRRPRRVRQPAGAVIGGLIVGIADALTIQYVDFLDGIEVALPLGADPHRAAGQAQPASSAAERWNGYE